MGKWEQDGAREEVPDSNVLRDGTRQIIQIE